MLTAAMGRDAARERALAAYARIKESGSVDNEAMAGLEAAE